MKTIHLQIQLTTLIEPEKPKTAWYKLGYGLAQIYRVMKSYEEVKSPAVDINQSIKNWSKDYSDLDTPAVIRKERASKDA